MRTSLILTGLSLSLGSCALFSSWMDSESTPPNIVIIYTDDQGWADVGVQGAQGFKTPHMDRLAAEGTRFTSFYVAQPVCSASRAALLTGCYPNRIGIHGALGPRNAHGIHAEETTLAELCQSKGYTTGMFGKWHLGYQPQFLPAQHGFDESYGIPYSNDMWPWHPNYAQFSDPVEKRKRGYPDLFLFEGLNIVDPEVTAEDQMRFTQEFGDRAVSFIQKNADKPFFLYLAHPMPHVPLFTQEESVGRSKQGRYGDVIEEIDDSVGKVMQALEEAGVADNTLVIYASDNGPWLSYGNHAGSTGPLHEGKGTTFEGGVRVPCLIRFPDRVPAGRVNDTPWMTIDILPTVAELLHAELPKKSIDGKNAWPLWSGENDSESPQKTYFFYYRNNELQALRQGPWKLHFPHGYRSMKGQEIGADGTPGTYDYSQNTKLELYNLSRDISESLNIKTMHPELMEQLLQTADVMRAELGDTLNDLPKGVGTREPGRVPKP